MSDSDSKDKNIDHLPLVINNKGELTPVKKSGALTNIDPLKIYLKEISSYDLLTPEQEAELTQKLRETGDIEIAKQLVLANLRLVVKIAMEYRHSYTNVMDLIQEGNIGLMKGVSKYDPDQGAKLSYYASWWIRSYILKFILDNFRMVKVGTTSEQKKLFYNLMKEKQRLLAMGIKPDASRISKRLGVSEKSVIEMDQRIGELSGDISFDSPHENNDGDMHQSLAETLSESGPGIDELLAHDEELHILKDHLGDFLGELKERDRDIFKKRLLRQAPLSLQAIADEYGVSRERIRQVEARLIDKLRVYMKDYLG